MNRKWAILSYLLALSIGLFLSSAAIGTTTRYCSLFHDYLAHSLNHDSRLHFSAYYSISRISRPFIIVFHYKYCSGNYRADDAIIGRSFGAVWSEAILAIADDTIGRQFWQMSRYRLRDEALAVPLYKSDSIFRIAWFIHGRSAIARVSHRCYCSGDSRTNVIISINFHDMNASHTLALYSL